MSKYNVGDVLQIRQWDDMVAEFGFNEHGSIAVPHSFTQDMRGLCGQRFTVAGLYDFNDKIYKAEEDIFQGWSIGEEMLEPYLQELEIVSDSDFQTMLS